MQIPYTKPMENVIKQAGKIARERKHPYIGTEHLLLALRKEYSGVAGQVLAKNGVDAEKSSRRIDEQRAGVWQTAYRICRNGAAAAGNDPGC